MEHIKSYIASIHPPTVSLSVSLDCDTIVRTSTDFTCLSDLLTNSVAALASDASPKPLLSFIPPLESPPLWLHATRLLDEALRHPSAAATPTAVYTAYASALESVTAVAHHTYFRVPAINIIAAWVGEPSLPQSPTTQTHIVLVCRANSRQDDAALQQAHPSMVELHGHSNVHVLRLVKSPEQTDENPAMNDIPVHDARALASQIDSIARTSLTNLVEQAASTADKARRATRTTFRSWFTSTSSSTTALRPPDILSPSSPSRRTSFGATVRTPLFDPSSVEALTRRHADLAFTARKYSEAADAYVQLAADCRPLTGLAVVHEAAAFEMTALSRIHLDASRSSILSALERSMLAYVRASRPELAIRVTLRALTFCVGAGNSESALSFLIRARDAIAPGSAAPWAAATGNAFIDSALAVLSAATVSCYILLGKRRRASLYAYIAMKRFAALQFNAVAARLAAEVGEMALRYGDVEQHVDLVFANHDAKLGRTARAVGLYTGVFARVTDRTDVELQGVAVRGFLSTVADGAVDDLPQRWDGGVLFPLVEVDEARVLTLDMGEEDPMWTSLEDDVLEDVAYFRALHKAGRTVVPKRERRVETVISELRRRDARQGGTIGGSVEMKIQRLRELAQDRRKALRKASLLERSAVIGDRIRLHITLKNPLQFPLFVYDISAVVSLNGVVHSSFGDGAGDADALQPDVEFFPVDAVTLVPCSSHVVSVDVFVRRAGELMFIGGTWRFTIGMGSASTRASTPVPGFFQLIKRGRRLNKTRKQRASEMPLYEPDVSLSLNIVSTAPRLRAQLLHQRDDAFISEKESPELCLCAGEMREARLVIENEGDEAVHNMVLRIGTPNAVFIDIVPNTIMKNTGTVACAIAPDDSVTRENETFIAAETCIDIAPNGRIELSVWLRAGVPNSAFTPVSQRTRRTNPRESFDLLEDGVLQLRGRVALAYGEDHVRVCRIEASFQVRRSIVVSPRFMRETDVTGLFGPDFEHVMGFLLGIEVEHAGRTALENVKFDVFELCVTSRNGWKPMLLPSPDLPADRPVGELSPSQSSLRINETATIFTLLVCDRADWAARTSESTEESLDKRSWRTFRTHLDGRQVGGKIVDINGGRAAENRASTFFVLCGNSMGVSEDQDVVHVSVGWRTGDGVVGEMQIAPMDPVRWMQASGNSVPGSVPRADNIEAVSAALVVGTGDVFECYGGDLVKVKVDHEPIVHHDFFKDPLSASASPNVTSKNSLTASPSSANAFFPAEVSVKVSVKNVSPFLLDVLFSAPSVGGIADGDRGRHWGGDLSVGLRGLPGGCERFVLLTAVVICPGRFNVSRFQVVVRGVGGGRRVISVDASFVEVMAIGGFSRPEFTSGSGTAAAGKLAIVSPVTDGGVGVSSSNGGSADREGIVDDLTVVTAGVDGLDLKSGRETGDVRKTTMDFVPKDVVANGSSGVMAGSGLVSGNSGNTQSSRTTSEPGSAIKLLLKDSDDGLWDDADSIDEGENEVDGSGGDGDGDELMG